MVYVSDVSECAVCESECVVYVSDVSECVVCEDDCMVGCFITIFMI